MSSSTITKTTAAAAAALQCRTCRMTPPRRDQAVPVEAMLDYHGKSVADMIYELTTIAVTVDQDLPQWICVGCAEDLRSAYSFRQRCIDSNEAFLNEMSTDEMVTPGGTPPAIDPLMLKTEPCDLELMEMMTEEANETHGDGEDEYLESRATSPETSCDLGNSSHKQRKQRGCSKKGFSFSEIAVHYIKERDGKHWCIIDPISRCTYAQPILAMGNYIRHFRLKHPEVAARKGFVPGVPPEEMPDMMDTADQDLEPILPVAASRQSKKMVSRSTAPVWKFIEKYDDMYHCAIDPDSYCTYAKKQRNLTDFLRHFRAAHPKAAVARNLYPIKKPPMVKIAALQQLKKEPKQAEAAVAAVEVEAVVHPSRQYSASETKYNAIAIKYIKHNDGKYWCVIDPNSDCRYAQCRYDAGNFVRHFRTIHPLEAVEKNLVRQEKHIMLPPDERKRLAKKPFINADPALVLEACIKLMAVHGFPAQCFGWTGMRIFMMPLVKLFNVEISNASIAQHTHLAAETMVRTLQTEMKRKLISIHIELVAQSRQHFLTVSANYNFNHRTVTRVLGLIRVTEATPARQLKADLLDLLARYELSSKQIAVIVLSNAGSGFGMPKKLQKIFVESMVKPSFEYSAPDKEETLMRALAAELKGEFEVVCNVVGTLLSALNDFLPDTDPTVVRIVSFLTNLRSAQYKEFFTENQASQPPVWHPQRWLSKFKAIRSLIKQEPFFVELAQRHPELALDESDWQYLREYHYALLPLYTFIKGLEQAQFHIPFSTFYLNCLAVVKNVRGMVNRFSKPVSAALGKRLMELRDLNVFRVVLYLDPRFQYYSTAMLNAEQQSGAQNIVQCRTCRKLLPEDEAVSVESVLEEHLHQGKSIADLIFELSDIMLTVDQQLPQSICGGCVKDLRLACDFRQRCIDSNEAFLSEVGASSSSPGVGETTTSSNDPDMLILKMEPSDTELLEVQKEVTEDHEFTVEPTRRSGEKRRKIALSNIAVLCIKFVKERFVCNIDATSGCIYSQKTLDVNNFIRHFRTKHNEKALRIGLVVGVPAVEKVQDDQQAESPGSDVRKVPDIVRNLIKKVSANIYRCVIDERSRCPYLQMGHYLHSFVRHFRTAHPKAAASYKLFGAEEVIEEKPESPPPPAPSPEVPLNSADSALLKKVLASGVRSKHRQVLQQYVKPRFGKYWCTIDPKSRCRYAQTRYDMNNFLRHFRTLHPLEAFANDIMPKLEEKKRIVKRTLVCADNVLVLQACINMMALDGLPAQCFRWAGLHSLLEPFTGALDLDINEASILEHIHKAVERLHYVVRLEMSTTLVSVHIEPFVREGVYFLVVSANYDVNCKVMTRVLGLIRATEATPTGELKTRLLELFGRYEISEDRIVAIVLGNVASILGTPKKLQKLYTDSYTEPKFRYGDPDKEQTLMDALAKELEGKFDVVRNVISIILSAMNEIVPNTDLTFGCIERFLQNLRSPQYESFFAENQVSFPPLWRSQRWLCKFKSIRNLIKQEQFFVKLCAKHPELALAEADWQFMRDYHSAFFPLYRLIKELERTPSHGVFTNFYMKCLMAVKEVRAAGSPFSKPLSELLTKRLMALRQQKVFQAMLFMDPRFQYFKSVVLTLVQQDDAQNYILNIWNRINALKPNAQPSQFDEEAVKQEAQKDDDMDDFLSEMFGDPAEGSSKAVVPLNSAMTPVLQQLKGLEIEPRQPHDYDVWNHWLQRSMSHTELFSVAMVVMSLPTNSICLERSYAALVLADRTDGLSEQTLDELLLIRLNRSLFEKAVVNMYDWKNLSNSQPAE